MCVGGGGARGIFVRSDVSSPNALPHTREQEGGCRKKEAVEGEPSTNQWSDWDNQAEGCRRRALY